MTYLIYGATTFGLGCLITGHTKLAAWVLLTVGTMALVSSELSK